MAPEKLKVAEAIVQRNPQICAIVMPDWYFVPNDHGNRVWTGCVGAHFISGPESPFQTMGVPVFVHTVNNPADAAIFLGRGIGVYTDSYFDPGATTRPVRPAGTTGPGPATRAVR
jgi:hypothetical protein